ncbi:hypothetical protein SALBM311S_11892 [Streptomyces alboniger]
MVADLGDLALQAGELPHAAPHLPHLALGPLAGGEPGGVDVLAAEVVVVVEPQRGRNGPAVPVEVVLDAGPGAPRRARLRRFVHLLSSGRNFRVSVVTGDVREQHSRHPAGSAQPDAARDRHRSPRKRCAQPLPKPGRACHTPSHPRLYSLTSFSPGPGRCPTLWATAPPDCTGGPRRTPRRRSTQPDRSAVCRPGPGGTGSACTEPAAANAGATRAAAAQAPHHGSTQR